MTGDGLSRGLSDMWRSVVQFLPTACVFLVILLAGYLLARLARTVTTRALHRFGFDQALQRDGALQRDPPVERGPAGGSGLPSPTEVCARLAFLVVLLLSLQLAFGLWGPNPASDLLNALIGWLPRLFVAIVIVVVVAAVARAAHDLTVAALGPLGYARILGRAAATGIVTLGVIAALDQIGVATSVTRPLLIAVLATVAGVIVVGVGGGLVRPMQQRWEGWLDRAATESTAIRQQARAYAAEKAEVSAAEAKAAKEAEREAEREEARAAEEARRESARRTVRMPEATAPRPPDGTPLGGEPRGETPAGGKAGAGTPRGETPDGGTPRDDELMGEEPEDWEARWAAEEHRTPEPDEDRTQVITPPPPGEVPTENLRNDEVETVFVNPGPTVLTPGVRPVPAPLPDDDPTVPNLLRGETSETSAGDEEPPRFLPGRAGGDGTGAGGDDTTVVVSETRRPSPRKDGGPAPG
ncbi:MAG TPA: hypothetical protein VN408_06960 [Actinoplanes sp.]|nr:hypothetical protein [Actinoplanes sp.]